MEVPGISPVASLRGSECTPRWSTDTVPASRFGQCLCSFLGQLPAPELLGAGNTETSKTKSMPALNMLRGKMVKLGMMGVTSALEQKSRRGAREGRWELERSNRSKIWNESYRTGRGLLGE